MMYQPSGYQAKKVNAEGFADYSEADHAVWHELITRQKDIIVNRACPEFCQGIELLQLPSERVPQCFEISAVLQDLTGWSLEPVAAVISFNRFFELLASRRFPAATFIRTREELDYLKEPDIFHEIFGHCPLLTNPGYAHFVETFGKLGLAATPAQRVLLARIFWYTVEFGLVQTLDGVRAYGGGILSSIHETVYSLESTVPHYKPFSVAEALQTPYRIDAIQPVYFVIDDLNALYQLEPNHLMAQIQQLQSQTPASPTHPC